MTVAASEHISFRQKTRFAEDEMRGEAPPDLTPEDLQRRRALTAQIEAYVRPYLARNPRVKRAVDALLRPGTSETEIPRDGDVSSLKKADETFETFETFVGWDHLAFRSFDRVDGGLLAVARVFEKHGYTREGSLTFEAKKVDARWFAPPAARWARDARGDPAFPRLFVSHLRVDDLPDDARKVIERRVIRTCEESGRLINRDARLINRVAERGGVPWSADGADASADVINIALDEYETLSNASEYAAWTLVHGHALNHVAVAVHRLFEHSSSVSVSVSRDSPPPRRRFASLEACLAFLKAPPLSTKTSRAGGGEVKVSPDGGLRQAATVADVLEFEFIRSNTLEGDSRGVPGEASARTTRKMLVPASYVEFVDRLPIAGDAGDDGGDGGAYVPERSRRDGFETANADAIFESTFRAQQRDG